MKRPTPEQLLDFFKSVMLSSVDDGHQHAISEFYKRFDPSFDQEKFKEIGIQIKSITREPYLIEEGGVNESKTLVHFFFEQNPEEDLSFTLWEEEEEESFFLFTKQELTHFFELKFRRFSKYLNY